jgi:hypothetical protein
MDHALTRRRLLGSFTSGLAGLALQSLLLRDTARASEHAYVPPDGMPHFRPRAKSVIWLFMRGGVSHMESFDPKPMLNQFAGKSIDG